MIILLSGCASTVVKPVSDYVVRHDKIELVPKDFDNINEMRTNAAHNITISKILRNVYVNELEYENSMQYLYE